MSQPWRERVEIGDAVLYLGDCREILPTLDRVDAVVTDPPYAVPTEVAQTREIFRNAGDLSMIETAYRVHVDDWWEQLQPSGRAFVFCDGTSYPSLFRAMYSRYSLALLIWDKGRIGMGREFRKSHELILHGWCSGTPIFVDGVGRPDIIKCDPIGVDRTHPAEKPVLLIEELLRVCGETILDPFMGSGTTGVACARLGRRFLGIEIEERYFATAVRRITEAQRQGRLFDEPAPRPTQLNMLADAP